MKTEAVIFDLDGTLLNTLDDIADSMNHVLKENRYHEHQTEKYRHFVGNGARTLVERALPEEQRNDCEIDRILKSWREIYLDCWHNKTILYEGVGELLLRLKTLNVPMAILSNKPHDDVQRVTEHFFDRGIFAVRTGQKDHIPHKPAPDGVYLITDELKINCKNCLFVGDSSVDMQTARSAGITAVGVSWGFRDVDELLENGADHIIDEPLDLLSLL